MAPYVSVAERRAKAAREFAVKLAKKTSRANPEPGGPPPGG